MEEHPSLRSAGNEGKDVNRSALNDDALNQLTALVEARSGIVVGGGKEYLFQARLAPILRREGLDSLDRLAERVAKGGYDGLERDIAEAMATHETLFFRDAKPFEHLRTTGLPALLQRRPGATRLRIWSAAASTGQEAYSLAITLAEAGLADRNRAEIVATDLAGSALERARNGLYTQYEVQRGLSVHRLLQHFDREGQEWQVDARLRALCRFRSWNLLEDPAPLGRFDVVFCRNVLFYFSRPARVAVLAHIRRNLAPDGLLYLGASESAAGLDDALERVGPAYRIRSKARLQDQAIAPRADTGHRHSTRPFLTPTYQS